MSIVVQNDDKDRPDRPVRVVLEQSGFLGRFGAKLPWILLVLALLFAYSVYRSYREYAQPQPRIQEQLVSGDAMARDKVAIIRIEGAIMHDDGFPKWQIDRALEDDAVKAIVLRIDSPGGTVTGSDYLYHHLRRLREGADGRDGKPIVVSMGGIAASGGYYIAMAAGPEPDTIFAERSTWTGSIGVIIPQYNLADLLKSWHVEDESVVSGPLKAMGSPTRKLTPEMAEEERQVLQTLVDQTFDQFKEIIEEARPQTLAADGKIKPEIVTGQIFTAKQALDLGLVDKIGYVEAAIERAMDLAGLQKDTTRVVKYAPPESLLGTMLFGPTAKSGQVNLAVLLDMTAPRAYYLCSWLPAVVGSRAGEL